MAQRQQPKDIQQKGVTAPMHKKLKKWVIAAAALVTVAAVGVTLAFMFKKANVKNTFVPAEVSCTAYEKLDGEDITEATAKGGEKSDIRVENNGKVNEYLRVRLVSYFADAEGNVTGAEPAVYPDITLNDGWIAGSNHTYYYTAPVEPGGYTPVMCQPFTLAEKELLGGTTIYQVVEVFAEAVQAEPADAAQEVWGVTVENGIITTAW